MTRFAKKICQRLFVLLLLLFPITLPVTAQSNTADIVGTVTDTTGAIVPKAPVTVINMGTGEKRTVQANDAGEFTFSLLQVGSYSIQVQMTGFKTFRVPQIAIAAGDRARIDAQLQPGAVDQVVDVTSVAPALQTDSSTTGSLVDDKQVQDLPLNGRNIINLVQVQPGVNSGLVGSFGSGTKPDDHRQTSTYSANGQTDQANNNLIDGFDNNERMIGVIGVRPSPEAVDQIKISTGLYTADIGRSAGGVADIITKSGTNRLHGSLYEYFRNDLLDASNYFAGGKPELRQNQFGGSLGGPIRKGKTFFFGDYEGFRQVAGQTFLSTVPTAYEESHCSASGCDLSDVSPCASTAYGTFCNPGPRLPGAAINPIGLNYFKLYPTPNHAAILSGGSTNFPGSGIPINNFTYSPNLVQNSNLSDVRLDHHFNDKNTLYGRYSFNDVHTILPSPLPAVNGVVPGGGTYVFLGDSKERQQQAGFTFTHVFSSNLLLELKAGYLRSIINQSQPNAGSASASSFGFTGVNVPGLPATDGLPSFIISTYASLGDSAFEPEGEYDNSFQYMGDLTWTHGKHNVKVGGGFIRRQAINTQSQFPRGAGYILGAITYNILGDLLLGQATSIQRQTSLVSPYLRSWEPSGYVQDDWRIAPSLTLNLGVRYDVFTPYTAHNNAISNFDFSKNLIVSPSLSGANHSSDTAGVKTYYGDVAPRIGFAYDAGRKLVVRGGFGISYFPDNFTLQSFLKNAPYTASFHCGIYTDTNPCTGVYQGVGGIPGVPGGNYVLGTLPVPSVNIAAATNPANYAQTEILATDFNLRPAYVEQYSLNVQKEIASNVLGIAYVGNVGRRIVAYPNANQAAYAGAATPIASLPTTIISDGQGAGVTNYNALQLTAERRLSKGFSGNVNYTFAHNLGDVSSNAEAAGGAIQNGNRFTCVGACHVSLAPGSPAYRVVNSWESYDYGNSEIDVRHRVAVTLGYDLPFGSSFTGVKAAFLKGWSVNTLYYYQTGVPFTVENNTPVGGTSDGFTNSNDRPDVIGTVRAAHPTLTQWFNTAAFATQYAGTLGNEGKNQIFGPRTTALNFSLFKTLPIHDSLRLQLRAESFNLTNTPSFSPPGNEFGASGFGVINSTNPTVPSRQFQFAAKLLY